MSEFLSLSHLKTVFPSVQLQSFASGTVSLQNFCFVSLKNILPSPPQHLSSYAACQNFLWWGGRGGGLGNWSCEDKFYKYIFIYSCYKQNIAWVLISFIKLSNRDKIFIIGEPESPTPPSLLLIHQRSTHITKTTFRTIILV